MRDITLEDTIYLNFTTRSFSTGVPTVLAGSPALSVLESNNATPITAGVSVQTDRASVVGLNQATIVATAANGYEAGKSYSVYISTGTVGGVSVVGEVVGQFTIQASAAAVDLANGTDGLGALNTAIGTRLATSGYTAPLDAAGVRTAVGLASANLDTQLDALPTAAENQSGMATATALSTVAGYLDTEVAAIKAKTDNLPAAPAATGDCLTAAGVRSALGMASANLDTQLDALPTAAEIQSGLSTLDAAGVRAAVGLAAANLDTQLDALPTAAENQSGMATASALSTVAGYLDTEVAAIKAKTDSLTFTEAGKIDANLLSIGTDTAAAAAFKRAVLGNTIGTIGAASTTTSLVTSSLTPAASVADQFLGRILTFAQDTTTAALRGQATDITASTSGGVLAVTALTTAPVSGDTFAIT